MSVQSVVYSNRLDMTLETYVQLHHCFDGWMAKVKKIASAEKELRINSFELDKLTPEQQVKVLYDAHQTTSREIEKLEKLEYYCFAEYEQLIFKIYSNRILCNEKNEEQAILKGYTLFEIFNKINQLLIKAKKQVPLFTSDHFRADKPSVVFYELNEQPYGTTDKDYLDIRTWQINQKRTCSQLEFYNLKENFIAECKASKDAGKLLQAEITQLENIYNHAADWTASQLLIEFSNLKGLTGILMPEDKKGFHELVCKVIKGDKLNGMLSPQFFKDAHQQINESRISPPPILVVSLLMYLRWLGDVLKENEELSNNRECSLDYLFFNTYNLGFDLGAIAIDNCIKRLRKHKITDEQYREKLILEYNKQRENYNDLVYPDYFSFLEKEQKLKNCFINDCLYSMNNEILVEQLKRAIVLNEMINFLDDELRILNHNPFTTFAFQPINKIQMAEIFCHLAPDSLQIKELLKIITKCTSKSNNGRLPVYFISEEMNIAYAALFKNGVIKYKHEVEMMDPDKRRSFITEQLRDIKYMGRMMEIESNQMNPYYLHLKHIIEDELENINNLQIRTETEVNHHPSNKETKEKIPLGKAKKIIKQPISFGYYEGLKPLMPILKALQLRMKIFAEGTTESDFMEVITCKDLSKNKKIIYFECKTIIVEYLREKLIAWCPSLTPANMAHSGIFVSRKEGPITANCLYNSKTILLDDSDLMDEIFNAKYD